MDSRLLAEAATAIESALHDIPLGEQPTAHLYQRWADHYADAIHASVLKVPERMPSVALSMDDFTLSTSAS